MSLSKGLPIAPLRVLRFSLSSPDTLPAPSCLCLPHLCGTRCEAETTSPAPGLLVRRYPCSSGHLGKETTGPPKFPSCPCECMPRSQTPVVLQGHRHNAPKTAAFRDQQTVGFPPLAPQSGYPNNHNYAISGLNHAACTLTPSGFVHPIAGNARGLHADLLAGPWSGGTRFIPEPHPLGNNSEFPPALRESQRLGFRLARIDLRLKS
jgi:hypothetical protein